MPYLGTCYLDTCLSGYLAAHLYIHLSVCLSVYSTYRDGMPGCIRDAALQSAVECCVVFECIYKRNEPADALLNILGIDYLDSGVHVAERH